MIYFLVIFEVKFVILIGAFSSHIIKNIIYLKKKVVKIIFKYFGTTEIHNLKDAVTIFFYSIKITSVFFWLHPLHIIYFSSVPPQFLLMIKMPKMMRYGQKHPIKMLYYCIFGDILKAFLVGY